MCHLTWLSLKKNNYKTKPKKPETTVFQMCKKTYLHNTGSDWVPGIVVGQLSSNNFHFQPQTDPLYLSHRKKSPALPFQPKEGYPRVPGSVEVTWASASHLGSAASRCWPAFRLQEQGEGDRRGARASCWKQYQHQAGSHPGLLSPVALRLLFLCMLYCRHAASSTHLL